MTETINPLPSAGNDFLEVLNAFLGNEDANRAFLQLRSHVSFGGIHGTAAGLTSASFSTVAFPGGYYATETASITYANNQTTHIIMSADNTGNLGGYTRVAGTRYLTAVGVSAPTLPANCVRLMTVTTSAGAITAVVDKRELSPLISNTDLPYLRLAGTEVGAADVRLVEAAGDVYLQKNVGTFNEPVWTTRFAWVLSNFQLNLVAGNTVLRSQTFPDKDGTFAMLSDISGSAFPPGTRMLFDNDTAPSGWVRDVSINDRVVKIASGARAPNGGSWTVSGLTASGHALTIAEMPSHAHAAPNGSAFSTTEPLAVQVSGAGPGGVAAATDTAGGGGQHTHNVASDANWRPLFRDLIVCQKS